MISGPCDGDDASMSTWTPAGGSHQLPFMAAASKALRGELGRCPRCAQGALRRYFHRFKREDPAGTLWLWCASCRTFTHLPRVQPSGALPDPFAELSVREFAALEAVENGGFLDRLERLWVDGDLG